MLHFNNLKLKVNFLDLYITSTKRTRICCSSAIFNMCYATPAQPKLSPTKLFNATLIQRDFFKLSENDFRGLHLHNLKSLLRYYFTLQLHNLTFTTIIQFDFRVLHLYNLKSSSTIRFCTLHPYNLTFTTFVQLDFRVLHLHSLKSSSLW